MLTMRLINECVLTWGSLAAANEWARGLCRTPNFSGIFMSTWSQTAVWSCISRCLSSIRRAALTKRLAKRWDRGEAGTAVGGNGGARKPADFVISRVMQDVWQLVRILTVLSFACLPPWQVVICALERFHWLPLAPWWGLRSHISGPDSRGPLNF